MSDDKKPATPASGSGGTPVDCTKVPCPLECKLVSITVIRNATQTDVTGAKNWAAVKKSSDEVVVEATTTPNTEACWKAIAWSGDSGVAGDAPNQRKLSRATSKKLHIEASLGGVTDSQDIWILWATVANLTSGTTPANAVQFGARYDGTENLGARSYNSGKSAVGKVVPVATITPAGVNAVVKSGWAFRRERISRDWVDGVKQTAVNYWNTTWQDDTSAAAFQMLTPDSDDKIYDRDAPSVWGTGGNDYETYNNFREWIEWNGMSPNETCSDKAEWYWKAVWVKSGTPQIQMTDVGTGNIALPADSPRHPPGP